MKKSILNCTVISPMFSYGKCLELRPTELKALMRYMYRAANLQSNTKKLFKCESYKLDDTKEIFKCGSCESCKFGDAENHPSPVRLQMQLKGSAKQNYYRDYLLKHRNAVKLACYQPGKRFNITIRTHNNVNINWYENWVKLSLILGGMGRRSRRGRGCVAIDNMPSTKQDLMEWVKTQLNNINSENPYQLNNNEIVNQPDLIEDLKRPVIEKIRLGKGITDIDKFLTAVDKASHHIKRNFKTKENFATGFTKRRERFASSLIISVIKVEDKGKAILLPIYTFVKPIHEKYNFEKDKANDERNSFISKIEEGYK